MSAGAVRRACIAASRAGRLRAWCQLEETGESVLTSQSAIEPNFKRAQIDRDEPRQRFEIRDLDGIVAVVGELDEESTIVPRGARYRALNGHHRRFRRGW